MALPVQDRDGLGETAGPGQPDHVGDGFPGGQFRAELGDAPVEPEHLFVRPVWRALVHDPDGQPWHQVGRLAGPLDQGLQAPLCVADEDLRVRPEPDPGPGDLLGHPADLGQALALLEGRRRARACEFPGHAAAEAGGPLVTLALHVHVEAHRERVHHRRPDAVQPARGGVGAAAELAARVQPGHHQFHAGQAGLRLHVDGDAAPVVAHLRGPVGVQHHVQVGAVAAQRLVHAVVDDLPEAVHQAAAVGGADVHAGPLADRFQALEHRQVAGRVPVGGGSPRPGPDHGRFGSQGFSSDGAAGAPGTVPRNASPLSRQRTPATPPDTQSNLG